MVLRFLFRRTPAGDLGPLDSRPADSPPPTSQGGSGNGARAHVARRSKEAEYLLANLEKEGVEIDDKIVSIIDDEVARIKAEVARENMNEAERNGMMSLLDTFFVLLLVSPWEWTGMNVPFVKQ